MQDINIIAKLNYTRNFALYVLWLIKEIAISAYTVSKTIWLNQEITPNITSINPTILQNDLQKVIYANSITLTPGTITIALENDRFLVHTLDDHSLNDSNDCPMAQRISQL